MIVRSRPRRPARWYPEGTTLTMRDGRAFVVKTLRAFEVCDPTYGNGSDLDRNWYSYKVWEESK